jgi:hypothetical protein
VKVRNGCRCLQLNASVCERHEECCPKAVACPGSCGNLLEASKHCDDTPSKDPTHICTLHQLLASEEALTSHKNTCDEVFLCPGSCGKKFGNEGAVHHQVPGRRLPA